jgi:hypothetical protein
MTVRDAATTVEHAPRATARLLPRGTLIPLLRRDPARFARRYRWPLLVLLAGAAADVFTTLVNLRLYGPSVEAHAVQRVVAELIGVTAGVPLAKAIQLAFVLLVAAWWRPWCTPLLYLCGTLYAAAAVSNHFLLL